MQTYRFARLIFTAEDGHLRHEGTGSEATLRPQAARLLQYLLDNAGEVVPRERLFRVVWGEEAVVDFESGLAALLRELRQAIRSADGPDDVVETVPRRGYRLKAEVDRGRGSRRGGWRLAVILAALVPVLIGTGFAVWLSLDDPEPERSVGSYSLAILPFEVYEPIEALPEHADLLMADTLLAELLVRPAEGLDLIGRTSLRPYVDREDVVSAVTEDLGVDLLVEGAVTPRDEGGWRAELRLLAVPPGRVAWSTSVEGDGVRPMSVRDVAESMASELVEAWPELRFRLSEQGSSG